ncbi:MAG: flagellin FliC3 [Lachnospiraceae bacterium]|nr:flagellin FliC3 [Lachnospiraceae bacterium]
MKINYNASAIIANNQLMKNDNRLADSLARLSSGIKIMNAKDNPSGLALSNKMHAQIENVGVATSNANDGISVIKIADGTLSEIHDMLQRLNELAVKSSTGSLTSEDRKIVDEEAQQLRIEIGRIAEETEFNGQSILDGSFDLRGYTSDSDVKVAYYSDDVQPGTYTATGLTVALDANGDLDSDNSSVTITDSNGVSVNAKVTQLDGNVVTITGDKYFELKLDLANMPDQPGSSVTVNTLTLDLVGFGAMDMQIGANEGQQLPIRIPKISPEIMGIGTLDLTTQESASKAIVQVNNAIKYVSSARSGLGAYQNRLEHTVNSLDITAENMTSAYSQIMDTDMAAEMTEYATLQVLAQASTSMLAQANERPSQVLQLLQ